MQGGPKPGNETEATLLKLMAEYRMDIVGAKLTMRELLTGFSLSYSLFLAWVGLLALLLVRRAGHETWVRGPAVVSRSARSPFSR